MRLTVNVGMNRNNFELENVFYTLYVKVEREKLPIPIGRGLIVRDYRL